MYLSNLRYFKAFFVCLLSNPFSCRYVVWFTHFFHEFSFSRYVSKFVWKLHTQQMEQHIYRLLQMLKHFLRECSCRIFRGVRVCIMQIIVWTQAWLKWKQFFQFCYQQCCPVVVEKVNMVKSCCFCMFSHPSKHHLFYLIQYLVFLLYVKNVSSLTLHAVCNPIFDCTNCAHNTLHCNMNTVWRTQGLLFIAKFVYKAIYIAANN